MEYDDFLKIVRLIMAKHTEFSSTGGNYHIEAKQRSDDAFSVLLSSYDTKDFNTIKNELNEYFKLENYEINETLYDKKGSSTMQTYIIGPINNAQKEKVANEITQESIKIVNNYNINNIITKNKNSNIATEQCEDQMIKKESTVEVTTNVKQSAKQGILSKLFSWLKK